MVPTLLLFGLLSSSTTESQYLVKCHTKLFSPLKILIGIYRIWGMSPPTKLAERTSVFQQCLCWSMSWLTHVHDVSWSCLLHGVYKEKGWAPMHPLCQRKICCCSLGKQASHHIINRWNFETILHCYTQVLEFNSRCSHLHKHKLHCLYNNIK